MIPVPAGRNRLNESERGPQQGANIIPSAAGYADRRWSDFLQTTCEEPPVCRDDLRRSAEGAGGGADRRGKLLPLAFRQVAGFECREQIRQVRGRRALRS